MSLNKSLVAAGVLPGVALLALVGGVLAGQTLWGLLVALACGGAGVYRWRRQQQAAMKEKEAVEDKKKTPAAAKSKSSKKSAPAEHAAPRRKSCNDTDDLVERMLDDGRYALLLRQQIADNLTPSQYERAMTTLNDEMALVPEGEVVLHAWCKDTYDNVDPRHELERRVVVEPAFLDRYPVTNLQFKQFVDGGGYEQMSLWDPAIWAAVLDFVDTTGHAGPRYWEDGEYLDGTEDHPVIGVCWYEAAAYARWAGKRLPTDPEWVKAGAWPVPTESGKPIQRKYPWGESMDRRYANIYGSQPGRIVAVTEFADGMSVGGVYQLIGNVWEWTANNFGVWDAAAHRLELPTPMKSIRGGAFDTYFEKQASCQFQSGDSPVTRKHNIGFRCALGVCDVAVPGGGGENTQSLEEPILSTCGAQE